MLYQLSYVGTTGFASRLRRKNPRAVSNLAFERPWDRLVPREKQCASYQPAPECQRNFFAFRGAAAYRIRFESSATGTGRCRIAMMPKKTARIRTTAPIPMLIGVNALFGVGVGVGVAGTGVVRGALR